MYFIMFGLVAFIFLIRLFFLQVIDDSYKVAAEGYTIRRLVEHPVRGNILDRNGEVLATNEFAYDLMLIPAEAGEVDTFLLSSLTGVPMEDFRKAYVKVERNLESGQNHSKQPQALVRELTLKSMAAFKEKMYLFPGYFLSKRSVRRYPNPTAAHALGYIREADKKAIENNPYYQAGDYIGVAGIEKSYEEILRGQKGVRKVYVDVRNNEKGPFMQGALDTASVAGYDLTTTLDLPLQLFGEELMKGKKGAIVAIEPSTGEILALVSAPSYDPNWMVGRNLRMHYGDLIQDKNLPMLNRAVMDGYPPGSIFKVMNALVGQQEGVIHRNTVVPCRGGFRLSAAHTVGCHGHPDANLPFSITTSCNAYYCHVFNEITKKYPTPREGYSVWYQRAKKFGFGTNLEADLPEAKGGLLPPPEYYDNRYGKGRWRGLTVISLAIGQGELKANALQIANLAAIVANKGYYITPHIGKSVKGASLSQQLFKRHQTGIDTAHFRVVYEGMYGAVHGAGGTARIARLDSLAICGKTGTAQNPHGKDHSVFMAFAPMENPKIAVGVLVENGGYGATWAAPIASLMIEKYLTDTISRAWLHDRIRNGVLIDTLQ